MTFPEIDVKTTFPETDVETAPEMETYDPDVV